MNDNNTQELQVVNDTPLEMSAFGNKGSFEHAQRVAKMLSSSSLIPKEFQGNLQNTMIALEMSNRIGASPLMVMQNLYIVYGKPSWSSSFIIAAINATKKFTPLRFQIKGEGDAKECIAWALENGTNERLESPPVTIQMAKDEGWFSKNGSKWKTMPDLMLRYRAATFFGRLYAPEVLMGMHTQEEVIDFTEAKVVVTPETKEADNIQQSISAVTTVEQLEEISDTLISNQIELTPEQQSLFDKRTKELSNAK